MCPPRMPGGPWGADAAGVRRVRGDRAGREAAAPEDVWEFDAFTGWRWRPEATEDDWASAFRAAEELLRARLGEPVSRPPDEALDASRGVVWEYGDSSVTLFEGAELLNYGQYDWICVDVRPRGTP